MAHQSQNKQRFSWVSDRRSLLPVAITALPLVSGSATSGLTGSLRLFYIILLALIAVAYFGKSIVNTVRRLPLIISASLLLFVIVSIISSLHAGGMGNPTTLLGTATTQFGIGLWICFLLIALGTASVVRQAVFNPIVLYIALAVGIGSLIVGRFDLLNGLRLGGLLYQPTSMAIYACLTIIIACMTLLRQCSLTHGIAAWLVLMVHTTIVIVTQSRIGWLCLLIILAVNGWLFAKKQLSISVFACCTLTLIMALPIIFPNYFSRYRQESVAHGSSYRLELFETAGKDILRHNMLLGNGTRALPADLNNRRAVPEDIARTLDQGNIFLSAHNLFIDLAYYFGILATITLLIIMTYGIRTFVTLQSFSSESLNYLLLFGVLLMNALVNVPTLELTPLFFIVLFGLFAPALHGKTK